VLRVTFDTLVAECADGAALITTARCEGYDVVLVGIGQAAGEAQSLSPGNQQVAGPSGPETALALSIDLCHVSDGDRQELTTEASYAPPLLTVEPGITRILGRCPRTPRKYRRQGREVLVAVHIWEILRLLSEGSDGLLSGSPSFTPVQQRWLRAAASLAVHAYLRRDIFVSDYPELSIRGGRRQALSRLVKTRLMTTDEFRSWLTRHQRRGKRPGKAGGSDG
jgi:hypothetical protein